MQELTTTESIDEITGYAGASDKFLEVEKVINNLKATKEEFGHLAKNLFSAHNKVGYLLACSVLRVEKLYGKKAKEEFIKEHWEDKSAPAVYKHLQVYRMLEGYSPEAKEAYFASSKVGVTLAQHIDSVNKKLKSEDFEPLDDGDFIDIINTVEDEGFNVKQAKDYIDTEYSVSKSEDETFKDDGDNIFDTPDVSEPLVKVMFKMKEDQYAQLLEVFDDMNKDFKYKGELTDPYVAGKLLAQMSMYQRMALNAQV